MDKWFLIILIVIFIFLVVLIIFSIARATSSEPPQNTPADIRKILEESQERTDFSKPIPIPGNDRSQCLIYTFPSIDPNTQGIPTYNKEILDQLTGTEPNKLTDDCIDNDQVAAFLKQRTCQADECEDSEGNKFTKGEIQIQYYPCKINVCKDQLALVSINFDPDNFSESRCLVANKNDNTISVTKACNIGSPEQLFRINRAAAVTLKSLQDGPYARILHRETGKCVVPETDNPVVGTKLKLGECNKNSGFNWLLSPPVKFTTEIKIDEMITRSGTSPFGLSFNILPGENLCLVPKIPRSNDNEIGFAICEEYNLQGVLWFSAPIGEIPSDEIPSGTDIFIDFGENQQQVKLLYKDGDLDVCLFPNGQGVDGQIIYKQGSCTDAFVWDLDSGIPGKTTVTPNQMVFTTSKKFPPKTEEELKKIIAEENPLSMISKTDTSISLDVFGTDNKDRRYITQILNYEIYKEITTVPNVSNLGINFPF